MIENEIMFYLISLICLFWIVVGLLKIFLPNYDIKKYLTKEWKPPNENLKRFIGLIHLGLSGYILIWLWEIKL